MFQMRRKRQELTVEEIEKILHKGMSGVLALSGDDGYPYAVPMSYVYENQKIYFHCAKEGRKLDIIQENANASFCVVGQDKIVPEEYTTYYRSVIAFGKIQVIEDELEKQNAIEKLAIKYAPKDTVARRKHFISQSWESLCMLEMELTHMSGKEAIELVKKKY